MVLIIMVPWFDFVTILTVFLIYTCVHVTPQNMINQPNSTPFRTVYIVQSVACDQQQMTQGDWVKEVNSPADIPEITYNAGHGFQLQLFHYLIKCRKSTWNETSTRCCWKW